MLHAPARPLSDFGSLEVKDVELLDPKPHKDFRGLADWLTRNLRNRLTPRFAGTGPKLVLAAKLDPRGLREVGGLIHSRWSGTLALDVAFTAENGELVARLASAAEPSPNGQLAPAGDRLVDDVEAFLSSRP